MKNSLHSYDNSGFAVHTQFVYMCFLLSFVVYHYVMTCEITVGELFPYFSV